MSCLARIGKDLYMEFDAIDGLALHTLNDAKSAYSCFRWEPTFFERCTVPPTRHDAHETTTRRRPLQQQHPQHPVTQRRTTKRQRRSQLSSLTPLQQQQQQEADDDLENSNCDNENNTQTQTQDRFVCRIAFRALAPVIRPRKDVIALRIQSRMEHDIFFVSFEFQIRQQPLETLITVEHRIRAADAVGVQAEAGTEDASEMRCAPRILSRLLEPLKSTQEAALTIQSGMQTVSASSYHHSDSAGLGGAPNPMLLHSRNALFLKTETAIGCDEFEEFDFHQNRELSDPNVPRDVNQQVVLVFPLREAKAMLQFCSQTIMDQELIVSLFYYWAGRPLVMETSTDTFSARLVLATLDNKLLTALRSGRESATN